MTPPRTETELLTRAHALAGQSVAHVATTVGVRIPDDPRHNKGTVGQLVELALGATAKSLSEPDFPQLGVELKTIPIGNNGRPRESTHVCVANLLPAPGERFEDSCVFRKLARVLWLPVEADPAIVLPDRRFGMATLWSPTDDDWHALMADWDEIMEQVRFGHVQSITARHGEVLQLRPKGRSARDLVRAIGPDGTPIATNPRAFYLRPRFTLQAIHRSI